MAGEQRVCPNCGRNYYTKKIKVYVFKKRYCPTCEKPMFSNNRKKIHMCEKCGLKVDFDDVRTIASMKVEMRGASRDINITRKNERIGLEVVKDEVPKHRVCQTCRNIRGKMEEVIRNKTRLTGKEVRELSNEEVGRIFHQHVQAKIREEDRKKREEEAAKVKGESKSEELPTKPAMLTTPFRVIPTKKDEKDSKK